MHGVLVASQSSQTSLLMDGMDHWLLSLLQVYGIVQALCPFGLNWSFGVIVLFD